MSHAQVGRLAMRQEGDNWCAYYAMPATMEGALFLGSVRMAFVQRDAARKDAFMAMMREALGDILEDKTGTRPVWGGPRAAPAHERSRRA